jgi:hypothetical protein
VNTTTEGGSVKTAGFGDGRPASEPGPSHPQAALEAATPKRNQHQKHITLMPGPKTVKLSPAKTSSNTTYSVGAKEFFQT